MAKANVNPDAIEKITILIAQTEKSISELNATISDTYSVLLDVENSVAHLQRTLSLAESMLKPDATQNNTKQFNLVDTDYATPTGDNTLD